MVECIICLNSIDSVEMITLQCNHNFHRDCIEQWFSKKQSCPTCRTKILFCKNGYENIKVHSFHDALKILQDLVDKHSRIDKKNIYTYYNNIYNFVVKNNMHYDVRVIELLNKKNIPIDFEQM